jgi:hypothetical protein
MMWGVVSDLIGWPTTNELPNKYRVYWIQVETPSARNGNAGAIFVMASDLDKSAPDRIIIGHKFGADSPRLYKLPYSPEAHKQAQGIVAKIKKGMVVRMQRDGGKGQGTGGKGQPGERGGVPGGGNRSGTGHGSGSFSQRSPTPLGYELPPPSFPDKGPQE